MANTIRGCELLWAWTEPPPIRGVSASRVIDQLSDGLIFGRFFQADKRFSAFCSCANLYTYLRTICTPKMALLWYCFTLLQASENCIRKLQILDDTINFRTLLIQMLESSVKPQNLVGRYSCPSPHKAPNFGFCCNLLI